MGHDKGILMRDIPDSCKDSCIEMVRMAGRVGELERGSDLLRDAVSAIKQTHTEILIRQSAILATVIICLLGIMGTLIIVLVKR